MHEDSFRSYRKDSVEIILDGGPDGLARSYSTTSIVALERRIKIPYLNGYEHFELASDSIDEGPLRFHWTMQTKIAE